MKDYGKVRGAIRPPVYDITDEYIYIASNVQPYEEIVDGYVNSGYEYDYVAYTKNEYLILLINQNNDLQAELLDTQSALCDVYELLNEGGI